MKTSVALAIVGAVVVITLAIVSLVLGLAVSLPPDDERAMLLVTMTLAVIGPTVLGLLALLKANRIQDNLDNGAFTKTARASIRQAMEERDDTTRQVIRDAVAEHTEPAKQGIRDLLDEHDQDRDDRTEKWHRPE